MFKIDDIVANRITHRTGRIIEINTKYGWFRVRYDDGFIKEYRYHGNREDLGVYKLTPQELNEYKKIQRADELLRKENAGITDHWRD